MKKPPFSVMAGLDPGIHESEGLFRCVDGRVKPGHDGRA